MGIFSKLLGSDKIISSGISAIDAMIYTDEEKSENKMKFLKLYEPFKVAQRYLSLIFGIPYASAWFITFIASFFLDSVDPQIKLLSGTMGYIVLAIVGFYFGGGAIEGAVKSIKNSK